MTYLQISQNTPAQIADAESDYGSDLDEAIVDTLLSQAQSFSQPPPADASQPKEPLYSVLASIEGDPVLQDAPSSTQRSVRSAHTNLQTDSIPLDAAASPTPLDRSIAVGYHPRNRETFSRKHPVYCSLHPERLTDPDIQRLTANPTADARPQASRDATPQVEDAPEQPGDDPRSPLQRFRTPPKKPFSVTDFVSPAWCEQQYWYSLTRYGRVRKTPAMKQGSSVHKVLEEQVHREVKLEVVSREDAFGLRIWNVIQGLRTLRATGMTRELEVWGVLEGQVVNGIIDEVGTRCPDEAAEERMLAAEEARKAKTEGKPLEAGQKTLTNFLTSAPNASVLERQQPSPWLGSLESTQSKTFYLTDVKTRQSHTLPAAGSPSNPTYIQLQLYRSLLASLASNTVPAAQIFQRYNLDPNEVFSDTFIAEVSQLDSNFPDDVSSSAREGEVHLESSQDSVSELLAHNTLLTLWEFMMLEFARTIPDPFVSLSALVTAEYRASSSGGLIGTRSFVADDEALVAYMRDQMAWWKGERPTRGVEIEDAFKCGFCEFAHDCTWRKGRVEDGIRKARLRKEAAEQKRRKSEV